MVYIATLKKNIWPHYIPPYEDELFSSWLYRLIKEHQVKPLTFINSYFDKGYNFWNRDVDLISSEKLMTIIFNHTLLNKKEISDLFLIKYDGYVFEKLKPNGYNQNITRLGINHRKRKRNGLSFCPKCLKEKTYYKTSWRLFTSILCVKCNCYLHDRCPKCGSPVAFHRLGIGRKKKDIPTSEFCSNCLFDLSLSPIDQIPSQKEIAFQKFIDSTIKKGYNSLSDYSFTYIKILLHLCKRISTCGKHNTFRNNTIKLFDIEIPEHNRQIIFTPIKDRRILLITAHEILSNWPNNFNKIRQINHCSNYQIIGSIKSEALPFWFDYNIKFNSKNYSFLNSCK